MSPTNTPSGLEQECPLPSPTSSDNLDTHALNSQSYNAIARLYLQWSLSQHPPLGNLDSLTSLYTSSLSPPPQSQSVETPTSLPPNPRLILFPHLLSLLSPSSHVLDLGCGAGVPCTLLLAQHCWKGKVVGVDSSEEQIKLAREYVLGLRDGDGKGEGKGSGDGAGTQNQEQKGIKKGSVQGGDDCGSDEGFDFYRDGDVAVGDTETEGEIQKRREGKGKRMAETEFIIVDMMSLSFLPGAFDAVVAFYSIIHLPREEQREMLSWIARLLTKGNEDDEKNSGGYLLLNLGTSDDPGSYADKWLGSKEGRMFWSSWNTATNLEIIENAGFEVLKSLVIEDENDGKPKVPFLWVLARKT